MVPVGGLDVVTMKEGGKKLARLLPFWWVSWVGEWVGGCGVVGRGVTADAWKGAGFQAYAARGGRGVKKTRTPWPKPQAPNPRYPRPARHFVAFASRHFVAFVLPSLPTVYASDTV